MIPAPNIIIKTAAILEYILFFVILTSGQVSGTSVPSDAIKKENPDLPAFETYDELMAAIKKAL